MCNIAGYIGPDRAAPILLKMMEREEAFDAGCYTGIATVHEGKLYWRKVVGSVKNLIEQTDAMDLPGKIGIIHGRTPGRGDWTWAHPFVNPEESFAYVANGAFGLFHVPHKNSELARRLYEAGYEYRCVGKDSSISPEYAPGKYTHNSEVMCYLIDEGMKNGLTVPRAMERAFNDSPAEIVGLVLDQRYPDRIHVARVNAPMMVGHSADAVYLATTAMAFPEDAGILNIYPVPVHSTAEICVGSTVFRPFAEPPAQIPQIADYDRIYEAFINRLKEGPADLDQLEFAIQPCFPENTVIPRAHTAYELIRMLRQRGDLEVETTMVPGVEEGLLRPRAIMHLV